MHEPKIFVIKPALVQPQEFIGEHRSAPMLVSGGFRDQYYDIHPQISEYRPLPGALLVELNFE